MIKQGIISSILLLLLGVFSSTTFAQKTDHEHRCFKTVCEGSNLYDDLGTQYKIIMIVPYKSVLLYSDSKSTFKTLKWSELEGTILD